MPPPLHDAHNHLHDRRFDDRRNEMLDAIASLGLATAVVNGTSEQDWPAVSELAAAHPAWVLPSFGLHPWFAGRRSPAWKERLVERLDNAPGGRAAIGEIGLDKWIRGHDLADQTVVFTEQLRLAAERNLPATIHCLQAWGALVEILEREPLPERGFLLHAYGGPAELTRRLIDRGAFFSFNGYFLHERKRAQREIFRALPIDRLLVETDAPDMAPPADAIAYPLPDDADGKPVNHPGNIRIIHEALAELRGMPVEDLAARVDRNFNRLFA